MATLYGRLGLGVAQVKLETVLATLFTINGTEIPGTTILLTDEDSKSGVAVSVTGGAAFSLAPMVSIFAEGGYLHTGLEYQNAIFRQSAGMGGISAQGGLRISLP